MANNVLVLAGKKQSGKSSTAKFLYGYEMLRHKVVNKFNVNDDGDLFVPATIVNSEGKEETRMGLFDIYRTDFGFLNYCAQHIWPHIKVFSFADTLKESVSMIFDIPMELLRGGNEEKNTETHLEWNSLHKLLKPNKVKKYKDAGKVDRKMTVREVLQEFGTVVCRAMDDACWVRSVFNEISQVPTNLVVIDDCRFKNELEASKEHDSAFENVLLVKFTRQIDNDNHGSEVDLDSVPDEEYDLVLDNSDMTVREKNEAVLNFLIERGVVESVL